MKLKRLNEQVIVITGASSGIGLVTARRAAAAGARVVLVARSSDVLSDAVSDIESRGGQALYVAADVADEAQLRDAAEAAIERFGGFDTWVNDAGVGLYGRAISIPIRDQRRLFETNYWGVVHGSMIAVEHLRKKGGTLVNVGSDVSDTPVPFQATYCASKHAVKAFTDSLRLELAAERSPLSVTLIKPSAIDTPYLEHSRVYAPVAPRDTRRYPPELVADAILRAAERPVKEVLVGRGGGGGGYKVLQGPFEDWQNFEISPEKHQEGRVRDALFDASHDPRERVEGDGFPTTRPVQASVPPVMAGAVFAAGVAALLALTRSNGS